MMVLLEELKQAVSVVKEVRKHLRGRMEQNVERTRKIFNTLVISQREDLVMTVIKHGADKRGKALNI